MYNNKLILLVCLCITTLTSCQNNKNTQKKYKWSVSGNAPKNFPATFHYAAIDGEGIRGGGTLDSGWGLSGSSTGSDDPMPIPKTLEIAWMSYIENQFYKGVFQLDQQKIAQVFEEGYLYTEESGLKKLDDFHFVVNVAPGGTVVVWMLGDSGFQREVGFYQAEKTNFKWSSFVPMGMQDREKYVALYLDDIDKDSLKKHTENGIPFKRWANYRAYFSWKTTMPEKHTIDYLLYDCFNGERYYGENAAYHINDAYTKLPIPKEIIAGWEEEGNPYEYVVTLKIEESEYNKIAAFFKAHNNQGEFYIAPYIPKNIRKINLFLKSGDDKIAIALQPCQVKRNLIKK